MPINTEQVYMGLGTETLIMLVMGVLVIEVVLVKDAEDEYGLE